jgi:sugar phosphate isomerase/epimerase
MDLSLAFLTIPDVGPVNAVEIASEAGFQKVGLRLLPAVKEEAAYPLLTDRKLFKQVRSVMADTGIKIGDLELIRIDENFNLENYLNFLEVGAELGATDVTVILDDPDLYRATENLSVLCVAARDYGIFINLEPIPWVALRDLQDAISILTKISQPNSAILIDTFHFYRRSTDLRLLNYIPQSWLRVVQVCDAPLNFDSDIDLIRAEARTKRLFPGEGELDLLSFLRTIPKTITVSVEVPNKKYFDIFTPKQRAIRANKSTRDLLKVYESQFCS